MRGRVLAFLVINICVVVFLIHSVWTLLSLLVVDGSQYAISPDDLPALDSGMKDDKAQIIPKIIHQTYINTSIPPVWQEAQNSCIELHKDYEYILWTDKMSRDFIAKEYSWFLETFDNYPFGIMRADAIRYFVLYHHGGVYIDLDDGCKRRLDPLLAYPAWVRRTKPTGISNDVMGSIPKHPFFLRTMEALPKYNRNWVAPYITVMSSTGPLFLSLIWRHHNTDVSTKDADRVRILFPEMYMGKDWSFFTHHRGDSWHKWDSDLMFWMKDNWVEVTIFGFALAGVVFTTVWCLYHRVFLSIGQRNGTFLNRLPWLRRHKHKDYVELTDRSYDRLVA